MIISIIKTTLFYYQLNYILDKNSYFQKYIQLENKIYKTYNIFIYITLLITFNDLLLYKIVGMNIYFYMIKLSILLYLLNKLQFYPIDEKSLKFYLVVFLYFIIHLFFS